LTVASSPVHHAGYAFLKRALDLCGAVVGILVLGIILPPVALAIVLDSPGPVFYVQWRVGKDQRLFPMCKFRTMERDAPGVPCKLPTAEDRRVTRVGRFLRRSGFDEWPQFVNVLRGEMSLVGPRPEQPTYFAGYAPWQRRRVAVLPGLTGWWQVNGRRQPLIEHIDDDLYYVDHRSLAFDLRILLLTLPALLRPEARFEAPNRCVPQDTDPASPWSSVRS
jgi:lipopolysaccharide/colanic/teichoic acid biosynthesis glycosyltransferase